MADSWEDVSDDDWDNAGDDLDLNPTSTPAAWEDEEEDLALKEKAEQEARDKVKLAKKGNALEQKKEKEAAKKLEVEAARKAMQLEAEMEANMTPDEKRALQKKREEEQAVNDTMDLFGGADLGPTRTVPGAMTAGGALSLKSMQDHLVHAAKVGEALKKNKNGTHAVLFLKEVCQKSKDVLDDDGISDLIKTLNVIKNEKLALAKRKQKGAAQKSKKDKGGELKAKKKYQETFGDNDMYDQYDDYGADLEDKYDQFGF